MFILDVLALAASIGELTTHTRRARTAMWCALQMSSKDIPQFGIRLRPSEMLAHMLPPTLPVQIDKTAAAEISAVVKEQEVKGQEQVDKSKGDNNNNNSATSSKER